MNSNLPVKQRNGIFYKIFLKINQIFRKNKYKTEKVENNEVISNSNKQFKNDIKIDIENIEFNNEYQKKQFIEQLKENIEYIKQNYGEEYLTPLIVSKNLKQLQKTLLYLQSIGVLETIKTSASILLLTL